MFYAIEKRDTEWIVLAHGVAIMRCAEADMALEIVQTAHEQLHRTSDGPAEVPVVCAPSVTPQQDAPACGSHELEMPQHHVTSRRNVPAKLP